MNEVSYSRSRRILLYIVTIPSIIILVALLVFKVVAYPRILAELFRLRPNEDGSLPLVTGYWASYPADTLHQFYMWNITNPDEVVYEGAVPRLLEHGPYVYVGSERKENLTWSSDGREVSYRNRRFWHFNSSLSCPSCTESDLYFVPNVPYAGIASISGRKDFPPLIATIFDICTLITGSGPIQLVSAGGLLFNSFNDPIVDLQTSQIVKLLAKLNNGVVFGIKIPECQKAGLLACFNDTVEPEFRVQTGKGSINDVTKIISYGGKRTPDFYMGETALQECNDGGFNQQFLKPKDKLHVFVSYLGRSFELTFHEATTHDSVPTFVYRIDRDQYDTSNRIIRGVMVENRGVDYFPTWPTCIEDHTHNRNGTSCASVDCSERQNMCNRCCNRTEKALTPPGFFPERIIPGLLEENPLLALLSPPHMLWAPQGVSSQYIGQHPDEATHQPIEWVVNPSMGSVVTVHFRIQLNFVFTRGRMTQSSSLPNSLAPTFWVHAEVRMHEDIMRMIRLGGIYVPLLLFWLPIIFLLIAVTSFLVVSKGRISRFFDKVGSILKRKMSL